MSGRGSMIPIRPDVPDAEKEIDDNHVRIETAFRNYIHRADPDDLGDPIEHEFEVFVGHGNIIRLAGTLKDLPCLSLSMLTDWAHHLKYERALQLPPKAWLRLSIFNCSTTYIVIHPNGYCSVRMLGDIGHLSYDDTTFSGNHGFNW
jgi:hypothetical protein